MKRNIIILFAITVLLLGGAVFAHSRRHNITYPNPNQNTPSAASNINMSPATQDEQNASQQIKEKENSTPSTPSTSTTDLKAVTPVIVNATMSPDLQVRAYVSGIYEDGGTCTLTASQGTNRISKQSAAFKDATTTTCTPLAIPRSEFPSTGTWNLTISYKSTTAQGTSQTVKTEVK